MKTIRVFARGGDETELCADAMRQARSFFGAAVPLKILPDYEVMEYNGHEPHDPRWWAHDPRWWAYVHVTPERVPLRQSAAADQVHRQVQFMYRYMTENYGWRYGAGKS